MALNEFIIIESFEILFYKTFVKLLSYGLIHLIMGSFTIYLLGLYNRYSLLNKSLR